MCSYDRGDGYVLPLHVHMTFYGCSDAHIYLRLWLVLGIVLGLGLI